MIAETETPEKETMSVVSHPTTPIRRRAARLASCCLAAVALSCSAAVASTAATAHGAAPADNDERVSGTATDPDDTLGRLDIASVRDRAVRLDAHHVLVTYRVRLQNSFGSGRFDVDDRNLVIELNRDDEPGSERNVRVAGRAGSLVAEVTSNATREVIATVEVSRPTDETVQISGPRRLLGARSYFWTSNFHAPRSPGCGFGDGFRVVCQDSVPQQGWLRLQSLAWPDLV